METLTECGDGLQFRAVNLFARLGRERLVLAEDADLTSAAARRVHSEPGNVYLPEPRSLGMEGKTSHQSQGAPAAPAPHPVPVVAYLSGPRRGTTERLAGDDLRIGTFPDAEIRITAAGADVPAEHYATLHRSGLTYKLVVQPGKHVWVNGEQSDRLVLTSGDVLEIGKGGPVLRFRVYPPGTPPYKSLTQVFSDCVDCARYSNRGPVGKAAVLLSGVPMELVTQTSRLFRGSVSVVLLLLMASTVVLVRRSVMLEQRLTTDRTRVAGLAELLDRTRGNPRTHEELSQMLAEVEASLATTAERLEALEARSGAAARVIAAATRSIVLLQGAWGFVDQQTGRPLRLILGRDGRPLVNPRGEPLVTSDGPGPVFESFFTGTAFVATEEGLLLSNRHVALPWEYDEGAKRVTTQGWTPVMRRFVAYLPGITEPFRVELVTASEDADLAVLRCSAVTSDIPALTLSRQPPERGDEVIVLGYPLGLRALMARTDAVLIAELQRQGNLDFWMVAQRLSEGGHIAPLASRGIVGQVTPRAVVYDAETTHGGSGGPVLSLAGEVVAINYAVLPEFGGSNLGVPAEAAKALLRHATELVRP